MPTMVFVHLSDGSKEMRDVREKISNVRLVYILMH